MKNSKEKSRKAPQAGKNQGEGDKESARRYNEMQKQFVNSSEGREAIEHAGEVDEDEQATLEQAERAGKSRSKGEDPAVTRRPSPK